MELGSIPDKYQEFQVNDEFFIPVKRNIFGRFGYGLINEKNDILIAIAVVPYINATDKDLEFMLATTRAANPDKNIRLEDVHPNNLWKNSISSFIDSAAGKAISADQSMISALNADTVVIFPLKMDNLYLGKYNKCQYVLIHKNDTGDGRILYFYTDENARMIDKEIADTWGFLKFQKDSLQSEREQGQ